MSALVLTAADRGAKVVRGVHLLGKVTLMLWGMGALAGTLVPVEMLRTCAARASRVDTMLAMAIAARKSRAKAN
jgi:hypothetical protein